MIYAEAMVLQSLIVFLTISVIAIVLMALFTGRKSRQYRKEVMDLYVTAKIKSLAVGDSLDLVVEYESFKKWCKKKKLEYSNFELDDVIEEEIKERISEPVTKK